MSIEAPGGYTHSDWQAAAARALARPETRLFIDGSYVDAADGVIWVNTFDEGDMTQPFGGYKQSGNARDKCFDSLLSYTQSKSAWIRVS